MKEELKQIKEKAFQILKEADKLEDLEEVRVKILGRSGSLTKVLRRMGELEPKERPIMGKLSNEVRESIESYLQERKEQLEKVLREIKIEEESLDITADLADVKMGHRHPLYQTMEKLENIFITMGFDIIDGPEIETVANNFDLLNSPLDHPSREKSDTFYVDEETVLRTHTSTVQIRTMKESKPPIRMVSAGRTFRFDEVDATHSPMFHQMEGLVVDKNITMANLIHTLDHFVHEMFGEDIKTRYRPHYFPFTEPSIEVDVSCFKCRGEGCESCQYTGWDMELLGAGIVHPQVLENCGIDSSVYSGFAFGMGVDRIAMVSYELDDIRLLFDNTREFLEQF